MKKILFTAADRALLKSLRESRESSLQKELEAFFRGAKDSGLIAWYRRVHLGGVKTQGGSAKNPMIGWPDWMGGLQGGRLWVCETKRPDGKGSLRPEQVECLNELEGAGVLVIRGATSVEAVRRALDPNHLPKQMEWPGGETA